MKAGTFWYAMVGADGKPQGFARLTVTDEAGSAQHVDWELGIAFPGGTYEESREARHDAHGRTLLGVFRHDGGECRVERRERRLVGHRAPPGKSPTPVDREVPDDAVGGLGFVLAADLPLEVGARREVSDHNDAQGWRPEGRATFEVEGRETVPLPGGPVDALRVVLTREDGRRLPLWIDAERRIVMADWGGGMRMLLSPVPTRDLLRPPAPGFEEAPDSTGAELRLTGLFPGVDPETMFGWFTDPDRLARWWPQAADVGGAVGEDYVLSWREPAWTLRGRITDWDPGAELGFTWAWDHVPDDPPTRVRVRFTSEPGGTRVTVAHGPYEGEKGASMRDGHRQGWLAVSARLRQVACG